MMLLLALFKFTPHHPSLLRSIWPLPPFPVPNPLLCHLRKQSLDQKLMGRYDDT